MIYAIIIMMLWIAVGFIRVISLLGYKNHKDTLLDKILITPMLPIAYLLGMIYVLCKRIMGEWQ